MNRVSLQYFLQSIIQAKPDSAVSDLQLAWRIASCKLRWNCAWRTHGGLRPRQPRAASVRMDVQVKVDKKGANPANAGSKGMRSLFGTRGADNPPPVKLTEKAKSAIFGKRDDGPSSNSPAVEPPAATDTEERRVDPADGNAYTRQEFIDEYGGTAEWDQAAGSQ